MTASIVVGTAGHIDHGKSALVRALSGIDPDRLKEEQARGITIDLGFAHARVDDVDVAFVDVPGHERFVRNMLAGAGSIDAVLLVVAADESVMPQTREHFEICRLLGLDRAVVAVTKTDLVDADTRDLVALEAADLVAGSAMAGAECVAVSARTGDGLDALRAALRRVARAPRRATRSGVMRLPIDRVFTMHGFGTVVTGTLVSGTLAPGDQVRLLPGGSEVRIRGLQVHGRAIDRVSAPSRVAVNLGAHEGGALRRGCSLASPALVGVSRRCDAAIEIIRGVRPLRHGARVVVHQGASAVGARVSIAAWRASARDPWTAVPADAVAVTVPAGGDALVRLRLDEPIAITRDDRFVLRTRSPAATVGGGVVLDPEAPAGRVRRQANQVRLRRLVADVVPPDVWLEEPGPAGVESVDLVRRWGYAPDAAEAAIGLAVAQGQAVRVGGRVVSAAALTALGARVTAQLARFHADAPLEAGASRAALREALGPRVPTAVFDAIVDGLTRSGVTTGADRIALVSHQRPLASAADAASTRLVEAASRAGLTALDAASLAAAAGVSTGDAEPRIRALVGRGVLVRLANLIYAADVLAALKAEVRQAKGEGQDRLDVAAFKSRWALTRKHAIPLLEWLDRERVTRRVGDIRIVL